MSTVTQATRHAELRALERLKLPASQLERLLTDGACVRLWAASSKVPKDGLLVWSPLDADHVLVWLDTRNGNIVTCMPFSYSEEEFVSRRGAEAIENAKQRARKLATQWLLRSATPGVQHPQPSEPDNLDAAQESAAASKKKPHPLVVTLYTSRKGQRVDFPFPLLPRQLTEGHRLSTQRDVHGFLQRLLASDEAIGLVSDVLIYNGYVLEDLVSIGAQAQLSNGDRRRTVRTESTWLDCVMDDLEYARKESPEVLTVAELTQSLVFEQAALWGACSAQDCWDLAD